MIGTIIIFLLIFFVIVMGHEFGHFLIAKVNGIRVNEFAIGMGPKITGFKKGETEYVLRAFPLGGACIFEGEDGLEAAKEEASAAGTPADKTGRGALRNVPVDVDLPEGITLEQQVTVQLTLQKKTEESAGEDGSPQGTETDGTENSEEQQEGSADQ